MICSNCKNKIPGANKVGKTGSYRLSIGLAMMVLILLTSACEAGSSNVSNNRTATEVVVATATVPQGQTEEAVQAIEEPTEEPTDAAPPTASPTPTDLPTPTATLVPTITPRPTITEPASEPTSTPTQPSPSDTPNVVAATPTPIPSPTPQINNNAVPELVEPTDNVNISQDVYTFVWRWSGAALTDDQAFEVRIWREGEPHYGAFDARETSKYLEQRDTGNALSFSVSSAFSVQQNGNGEYFWSVAVVQLEPYQLVIESAPKPVLITVFGGSDGGGGEGGGGGHSYQ